MEHPTEIKNEVASPLQEGVSATCTGTGTGTINPDKTRTTALIEAVCEGNFDRAQMLLDG